MRKLLNILIIGMLVVSAVACNPAAKELDDGVNTSDDSTNHTTASSNLLTDQELVDRVLYLFDIYVLPVNWWTGAGSTLLHVNESEGVEPLEDTPTDTTFFQVLRFNSIQEMKRATEQVVTKEYAETNLYPLLEKNKQFLERDGKLYINTYGGAGGTAFGPVSATVLSKTEEEAVLSVVFEEPCGEQEVNEITLKRENGIWKLDNYPYLD